MSPLPEPVDLLLANLPYVGTDEVDTIPPDVRLYEPQQALFSGRDGLDLLRRLSEEAQRSSVLAPTGVMLLEIGYQQQEELTCLFQEIWPGATITCRRDNAGIDRLLQVETSIVEEQL